MANIKIYDASENERFLGWSWEVLETLTNGGVNVIDEGDCRFHFLVDIPSDFPGQFTGQPETLMTDRRFKHGTERTISNEYYNQYRYLSAWHIRNGTKANQGSFNRFYNNIFRWKSSQTYDINDFGAWEKYVEDNSLADTALPAGYPGFETAVVYEQGNATLGLPYNMGADAGYSNNLDHDYPPYKYHCDASNLTDVHDIAKYLDRTNTEAAATVMTNATLPTDMFNLAWTLDGSPGKPTTSADAETWIRSRLQIEQYDITYKTYWGLPTVEDQGEVTWIIKNVTPQHLYDPTHIGTYPEPYLYAYILTPTKIKPVKLHPSAYLRGSDYAYNHPSTSLSPAPGGIHFFDNNDEVLFGEKVPWCSLQTNTDTSSGGSSINLTVSGGTDPYTYLWNDGVTDANRTDLAAGTYTVTVTDANGCTNTHSATINAPLNIITTNLDLPDEPEEGEFIAAKSSTRWRIQARVEEAEAGTPIMWREILVKYDDDSNELGDYKTTQSNDGRYFFWVPEYEVGSSYGGQDETIALNGHSNLFSNRRYLNQNGMDLFFPFGIYKAMNHEVQRTIYASRGSPQYLNLTNRHGNISDYVDKMIPMYNYNGTRGTDPSANQFKTTSRVTVPPAYNDAEYSMTFDGFDADLWAWSTTMVPGFRYKNLGTGSVLKGHYLGQGSELWSSRSFAKDGTYNDTAEGSQIPLAVAAGLQLENNPYLELDGYMYYRGNRSSSSSGSEGEIGDAIFTNDRHSQTPSRRFTWDVARKPLSQDHNLQTVADALKERRSDRTVTKIPAYARRSNDWIDGEVKKFQSGDWYYPSNSQMSGTNFSNIAANTPYASVGNTFQNRYYFAKDFTIGST